MKNLTLLIGKITSLASWGKTRRFAAIDVDPRQVRIVHAEETKDGARLLKLASADVPDGLDIDDPQVFGEFLGRTLDQMSLRNTAILMNVPRSQAILKPLTLPVVATTGEMASMVQYQAEKELTFRPEETVVDFTIETHHGPTPAADEAQGEQVLVAAVQRPVVEYFHKVAEVAGARLIRLGLRPYANMRCLQVYGPIGSGGRAALIHITSDETEIDVIEDGVVTFSRSAMVDVPAAAPGAEAAAGEAALAVIAEVARSLHSYLGVESDHRVDEILVAGGTGVEAQVASELGRRLAVRCDLFNPSQALGLEGAGPTASAFISAIGLAVGQADAADMPFDFLNPKRAPVRRDMTRIAAVAAVAAVVVALVASFAAGGVYLYSKSSEVDRLRKQYNDLTEKNRNIAAMAKRVETVDGWVRGGRNWLDQWAFLSGVFPSCTDCYITSIKTQTDGSISLTVKAKSSDAINELGKRLGAADYDFRPGQVTTGTDPYGYTYSTTFKVVVKSEMKVDLASLTTEPRPPDDVSAEAFGRPAAARAATTATAAAGAAPAVTYQERLKAWQLKMETFFKENPRPPDSQTEAVQAWRTKREELRNEQPKPGPPPPAPEGKRRRE